MKKRKCMADGGMPQERATPDETPEWKKSLAAAWQAIAGDAPKRDKPATADSLGDTARRIQDRKMENMKSARYKDGKVPDPEEVMRRMAAKYGGAAAVSTEPKQDISQPKQESSQPKTTPENIQNRNDQLRQVMDYDKRKFATGGMPGISRDGNSFYGERDTQSAGAVPSIPGKAAPGIVSSVMDGIKPLAVSTAATPSNLVPTQAQGLAASGGFVSPAQEFAATPTETGNVFANPQAGNLLTSSNGQTMAEKAQAVGINPNAAYRPGSAQDPHASGLSSVTPAQRIAGSNATAAALAPNQPVPQLAQNPLDVRSSRQKRGFADGGMARQRFEGEGGPREDKIPVKVAGEEIKVSNGEEVVILPAKTAQNPQAIAAISDVIEQSNDGRKPAMGMSQGGKYAGGAAPHIVDARGQVYVNGRPAGYLPAPEIPEYSKPNFYTDSSGGTRAASSPRTAVGPYTGPGTAVGPYTGPGTAVTPYVSPPQAAPAAIPSKGMAYNAGKAAGKYVGNAGGVSGLAKAAANVAVPLVAAYQTFGDDGIKVQGNRSSDPNYDEMSGMPRVGSSLKELALRAGDWGTKGLDILGGWALPSGEASFNDAYRQGVGQLEGVSAPTSQQISEREKQKIAAQQVPVQQTPVTSAQADREIGVPQYPVQEQAIAAPEPDNRPRDRHGNDMTETLRLRDELMRVRVDNALSNLNATNPAYRQQGMAQLAALQQAGAIDTATAQRIGLSQSQEMDSKLKGQQIAQGGLAMQQAQELNALYQAHNAEQNPEKRSMIAEQIRVRTGKDKPAKYKTAILGGAKTFDGTEADRGYVVNEQTGEMMPMGMIGSPSQTTNQEVPPAGERKIGQTYKTPQGPMIWRGNGWEKAA